MCTNFVLIKTDGAAELGSCLAVDDDSFIYGRNFKPGSRISIVTGGPSERQVRTAIWWLYLQQTDNGLQPHRNYFSVNTNYRKLPDKTEYRQARCIVPATAFVESQNGKRPHLLTPSDGSAIAFGGLYKEWTDKTTGEIVWSASVITLPGHPALANIHRKSTPLWLPEDRYEDWPSPDITDTARFAPLLEPVLQRDLTATPIDKAGTKQPVADSFVVTA